MFRGTTPGETKLLASEIYEILQNASKSEAEEAEAAASCRRKAQFFLGGTNKRAKTVVLQIDGLDDSVSVSLCSPLPQLPRRPEDKEGRTCSDNIWWMWCL